MKKTKFLMTAFAVFAAVLMLITTSIARPIQEKTSIDAVKFSEKELTAALESFNVKISRDPEANIILNSIVRDTEVVLIANIIERAKSKEEVSSGVKQLVSVLHDKSEFEQLVTIVEEDYSAETEAINIELASMNYGACDLKDLIEILLLIIQIIQIIIQVINVIITLIDLIQNLIDYIRDLWDLITGGGDDGGILV